jgi:hypothetical protein
MKIKTRLKAGSVRLVTKLRAHDEQEDVGSDECY